MRTHSFDLGEMVRQAAERRAENDTYDSALESRVLMDLVPMVTRPCPFKVGDLVVQMKGFDEFNFGRRPCAVTHVFDKPHFDPAIDNPAEQRNDILIIVRTSDGTVRELAAMSWRFEKYTGQIA